MVETLDWIYDKIIIVNGRMKLREMHFKWIRSQSKYIKYNETLQYNLQLSNEDIQRAREKEKSNQINMLLRRLNNIIIALRVVRWSKTKYEGYFVM